MVEVGEGGGKITGVYSLVFKLLALPQDQI